MHPLRKLRESGDNTPAALSRLLSENVVFHSPVLVRAVEGREKVAAILAASPKVREGAYIAEYRMDAHNTFLRWRGKIEGHEIESLEILTDNDEGLVVERTIAYRPLPAVQLFRDAMYPMLKDVLPPDMWHYLETPENHEQSELRASDMDVIDDYMTTLAVGDEPGIARTLAENVRLTPPGKYKAFKERKELTTNPDFTQSERRKTSWLPKVFTVC